MSIPQPKEEELCVFGYAKRHCIINIPVVLLLLILKYLQKIVHRQELKGIHLFQQMKKLKMDEQLHSLDPLKFIGLTFSLIIQKSLRCDNKPIFFYEIKFPKEVLNITINYTVQCHEIDAFYTNTITKNVPTSCCVQLLCGPKAIINTDKIPSFNVDFMISSILKMEYYTFPEDYIDKSIIMQSPSYVKWTFTKSLHDMTSKEKYKFFDNNNWVLALEYINKDENKLRFIYNYMDLKLILLKFPYKIASIKMRYKTWISTYPTERKHESEWYFADYACDDYSLHRGTNYEDCPALRINFASEIMKLFEKILLNKLQQFDIHFLMQIKRITNCNKDSYLCTNRSLFKQNGIKQVLYSSLGVDA